MKATGLPSLPARALGAAGCSTSPRPAALGWSSRGCASGRRRACARVHVADAEAVASGVAATEAAAAVPALPARATAVVAPLPEKNYGSLRGGRWPFLYDNVYGLPVVRQVASYGEVLEGIRTGRISQVLWFQAPRAVTASAAAPPPGLGGPQQPQPPPLASPDGRCLVRFANGQVKQAVIPPGEPRISQALQQYGTAVSYIPLEPRYMPELAAMRARGAQEAVLGEVDTGAVATPVELPEDERRGAAVGPTAFEAVAAYGSPEQLAAALDDNYQAAAGQVAALLAEREAWVAEQEALEAAARAERSMSDRAGGGGGGGGTALVPSGGFSVGAWLDSIQLTNEQQAMVLKYVPILGPILGSGFIIGLYLLARLVKGDLTDRLKMMDSEADKKKKTALKEARIAFLEEEVPGLVAKGASLGAWRVCVLGVGVGGGDEEGPGGQGGQPG
ncbi:hypothetical protein CHLRE_04g217800v5 [Chlamydomonas reinhardtii]|uniref:Uncharacterized protein n=1 Tax=Chlamydomonas reinhardtii TaxID=3055 RepID=A0A2K3DTE3_CHLRE|nr:uncharacterized protein CHLRE_04g217800v5 [Chlamydomonas reinhardtii]PNW83795.1 hypothetical protein CHLRE_04g217800v5 [Chlamydomonas reinhardtii]